MKKQYYVFALLLIFSSTSVFCQTRPLTVVFSQNKCGFNHMEDLAKDTEEKTGPILNALVEEGMLLNWGVLTHTWGDEWNWNVYYVAESQAKFMAGWDEFVKRVGEKYPDVFERWAEWCTEHKDSIYTESHGYTPADGNDN